MKNFTRTAFAVLLLAITSWSSRAFGAEMYQGVVGDTIRINFSDADTPAPPKYLRDYGVPYSIQGSYTYGWVVPGTHTPLSLVGNGRNRVPTPDINTPMETLIHMQYGDAGGTNGVTTPGTWEIAVPNGTYRVIVVAGDNFQETRLGTTHVINAEGWNLVYQPIVYGEVNQFTRSSVIEVTDGRMTIDCDGGYNTKLESVVLVATAPEPSAIFSDVYPSNGATQVPIQNFQITVSVDAPVGYELDKATLVGKVRLFEQTASGLMEVPSNSNDTGGGDAITLTAARTLKAATTYVFNIEGVQANRVGNINDRITFRTFTSQFTTASGGDTNPPANLEGVSFTQLSGDVLGAGTKDRFSSLVIGPDGKLYASTMGEKIKRWTINADGTLANLEELPVVLSGSPNPVTGIRASDDRFIIGLAFAPESTASNLIAYVTHSSTSLTDGPSWDGKLTRLSGPNLATVQDVLIHLPRSAKDHLANSVVFGPGNDLFIVQGSNSAGGEPDPAWNNRTEGLLAAAVLRVKLSKLPATLPLSVYTTENIAVINKAPATGMNMSDGTYNPYSQDSPVTLYATGIRNAYDLVFHSNGWTYIPTNGTAGNNSNSPITPASKLYVSRDSTGVGIRRPNGTFFTDPGVPGIVGGETQKDWLFKTKGGSYHGHPNPYRGEFILNHGGKPYTGLPGQLETSYRDVAKYPEDLAPDPNYLEVAYDFGRNKSPDGAIEYKSNAFGGKLKGMLLVARFSGQDDIVVLQPGNQSGDIIQAFQDVPGLQSLDDPLDIIEHVPSGNLYVSQYDRDGGGNQKILLMRVADASIPAPVIASTPPELVLQATVASTDAKTDSKILTIVNNGQAPLHISARYITGPFASQFHIYGPSSVTIAPAATQEYTVTYTPGLDNNALGYQNSEIVFESDGKQGAPFRIGLHGLKVAGYGGSNEPALQTVVNVLGYDLNVGWTSLNTNTQPAAMGEEVLATTFRAAGAGPVTLTPVARYSPAEALPFGWYTRSGSQVATHQVGVEADGQANAGRLFPTLASGTTSFDPQGATFGLYLKSTYFNRTSYTGDDLNVQVPHRTRVYPLRNREGAPVAGSYLVCFEDATTTTNGDYQDYVFVLGNATPYTAQTQALRFETASLDFLVATGSRSAAKTNTIYPTSGATGTPLTLTASEPWVVLPTSARTGDALNFAVNSPGIAGGTYVATVTATAAGYEPAVMQLNATVTDVANFSAKINFQDNSFTPPAGYVADIGEAYGSRSNGMTYGWINPNSRDPQSNAAGAHGADRNVTQASSDVDKLRRSFNTLDAVLQNPPVPRDWEIAVPNGTYRVEMGAGDPNADNSRHTLRAEGVIVINDFAPVLPGYHRTGTATVEVTDGKLTVDDNGAMGIGNTKITYITLERVPTAALTGARIRIENMTKVPGTTRGFPAEDYFTFHRVKNSINSIGQQAKFHDKNVVRIHNSGTANLVIQQLTTSDTRDFVVSGVTIPTGGLIVKPGAYIDATVSFITDGGPDRQLITETLAITSNADNNATTNVVLRGAFMYLMEGNGEITIQQVINAFGFTTSLGRDATGQIIDRPGSEFPTDEAVNSGKEGDLVLSRYFVQADPSKPVRMLQMSALHGLGGAPTELRDASRRVVAGMLYNHGDLYYQSLLPKLTNTTDVIAGDAAPTIDVPFQILVSGYSTAGGNKANQLTDQVLGVRVYRAIDRNGVAIPNEYIITQDYVEDGCGLGTANCDWQDNVHYIINARPVGLPTAKTIADLTVPAQQSSTYKVAGSFTPGFPGNKFLYSATLTGGAPLPAWMNFDRDAGTFVFTPPSTAAGKSFDLRVTAVDNDKVSVNSSFRLTVTTGSGTVSNEPPIAAASATPTLGTAPLLVTLDGSGSMDFDGTIAKYAWAWNGGTATGVRPQVTFAAGTYSITLTVTDDRGATDTDVISVRADQPSTNPSTKPSAFWLEAECAQVGTTWTTANDAAAGNGKYVVVEGNNSMDAAPADLAANRVRFTVSAAAGNYKLFARINAQTANDDSYWVRINNNAWYKWSGGIQQGDGFNWNLLNTTLPALVEGTNTIDVAFREDGAKLDRIYLAKDGTLPTGVGSAATNCGAATNRSPVAVASATPSSGTAPLTVKLNGNGSSDPDGTIAGYAWNWFGGSATGVSPTVVFNTGNYAVTLTVTDNGGATATTVVNVNAIAPPSTTDNSEFWLEAECAAVGATWTKVNDGLASNGSYAVVLSGNSTATPPADVAANRIRFTANQAVAGSYKLFARIGAPTNADDSFWVRVNGGAWYAWSSGIRQSVGLEWNKLPTTLAMVTGTNTIDFAFREDGAKLDKLYLTLGSTEPSGMGLTASNCGGTIPPPTTNQAPVAVATATPTSGTSPLAVQFDGSGSSDPDGTIASYAWAWSGGSATGVRPQATFATGTYNVTLTVTDNVGAKATNVVSITATAPPSTTGGSWWLEAECASVGTGWVTQTETTASNGKYVVYPTGNSTAAAPADVAANRVRFTLSGAQAGNYHLFARIGAPTNADDSFWVRVNGGAWYAWSSGIRQSVGLEWNKLPVLIALTTGTNTVDFAFREDGAKLDKLHVNLTGTDPTGTGAAATNCGTVTTPPASTTDVTALEAECATVGSGWTKLAATTASQGGYVSFTGDRRVDVPTTDEPAHRWYSRYPYPRREPTTSLCASMPPTPRPIHST